MAKLKLGRHTQTKKDQRQSSKKQIRNKAIKSKTKTIVKKVEKAIHKGNQEEAKKLFIQAMSELDKAANKKVIHKNKASRKKSALNEKLNHLSSSGKHIST